MWCSQKETTRATAALEGYRFTASHALSLDLVLVSLLERLIQLSRNEP